MAGPKAKETSRRFNQVDLHDDNLLSVTVRPPLTKTGSATIDFRFRDYGTSKTKVLSFLGCGNLRMLMDFDTLAANWFAQTEDVSSQVDSTRMRKFVRAQRTHWHVRYMPPTSPNKPIRGKLSRIGSYCLFKVTFFGGTAEILAKNFALKPSKTK